MPLQQPQQPPALLKQVVNPLAHKHNASVASYMCVVGGGEAGKGAVSGIETLFLFFPCAASTPLPIHS
jgi:hypothetical protein